MHPLIDPGFETQACPPYGSQAAHALQSTGPLGRLSVRFARVFQRTLLDNPAFSTLLARLTTAETVELRRQQAQHLKALLSPDLQLDAHRAAIQRICHIHILIGLDSHTMALALQDFHGLVLKHLAAHPARAERHPDIGTVVFGRLLNESRWMLEAMRMDEEKTLHTLRGLEHFELPSARPEFWVETAIAHLQHNMEGLTGISFGRAQANGDFVMEFASKGLPAVCAMFLDKPQADVVEGAPAAAWQSNRITTLASVAGEALTDSGWRHLLTRNNVRSLASVPVIGNDGTSRGVFTFWGAYPGLFESRLMQLWLRSFQHVAELRFVRFARMPVSDSPLTLNERQRYRSLLANGHLVMFYQPILDLASGQVFKLEALARLRTEEGEILTPARFLPAFTDDDLIQLFRLGLQQALEWVAQSDRIGQVFDLSFNLPPEVLALPYCAEIVNESLCKAGIAPERLYLELLETESLPLSGSVADTLRDLSELGVALVMDDLGAGHSGLNRLSEFPFRIAKLDRDLTSRIASMGKRGIDFLDSLVRMIHALGMSCTMEGLENGEMIEAAGLVGVDHAQGYAIAHPLPPESVATWIKTHVPTPPGQPHYPLGQYARGFTRPPHLVDWDRAIAAHQSWLHEYEAALDAGNAPHWRVVSRDDACMLGRWLKRVRITLPGEQPVLDAIEQAHTAFHLAAGEHARTCQCDHASHSSKLHARIEVASAALLHEIERYRAAEQAAA